MRPLALAVALSSLVAAAQVDAGKSARFAVIYFEPNSVDPELQVFAKGLAALFISDFSANTALNVMERERIEDAIKELKLGESRFADPGSFTKAGGFLGVDYLLMGSLIGAKKKIAIAARLVRLKDGRDLGGVKVLIDDENVFGAEEEVVRKVTEYLVTAGAVPTNTTPPPKRTYVVPKATLQNYSKALDAKDKKDTATATRLLGEVVKQQPDFKLAQLDLLSLTK